MNNSKELFRLGYACGIFAALDSIESGEIEDFQTWVCNDFKEDFADETVIVSLKESDEVPLPPNVSHLRGIG